MTDSLILATGVTLFLIFMGWNATRLRRKDKKASVCGDTWALDDRSSRAAVTSVLRIAQQWRLDDPNLGLILGNVPVADIQDWRQQLNANGNLQATLAPDQLERAHHLTHIYDALHRLFADEIEADRWIYQMIHMPGFDGRAAIELMRQGEIQDLAYVYRCLDGWPT